MADLRKKRRLEILKKNKEKVDEENDKSEDYMLDFTPLYCMVHKGVNLAVSFNSVLSTWIARLY